MEVFVGIYLVSCNEYSASNLTALFLPHRQSPLYIVRPRRVTPVVRRLPTQPIPLVLTSPNALIRA